MGLDLRPLVVAERPIDVAGHELGPAAHGWLPSAARKSARPRWMRDITVPIGTSMIRAISS